MPQPQQSISITLHLVPRFSDPLHGIELPGFRLLVALALPPFLGRLGLWVAYLTRRLEASGVVGRRDDAEALVGPVDEADRVKEGGSGAGAGDGAVEAVDAGGLERPQLVGDFHLRRQGQGFEKFAKMGLRTLVFAVLPSDPRFIDTYGFWEGVRYPQSDL